MSGINAKSQEKGFTLIELLIYVALFGFILTSLYSIFISNYKSYSSQENTVEMTQDLRAAMTLMANEARMAGCDPEEVGIVGFLGDDENDPADDKYDTDDDSIHFSMDMNSDGDTFDHNEDIQYYLSANQLMRRSNDTTGDEGSSPGKSESLLAENITVLAFTYTFADGDTGLPDDGGGDGTTNYADIRSVEIFVQAQTAKRDALVGKKKTRAMTTSVKLRNAGL